MQLERLTLNTLKQGGLLKHPFSRDLYSVFHQRNTKAQAVKFSADKFYPYYVTPCPSMPAIGIVHLGFDSEMPKATYANWQLPELRLIIEDCIINQDYYSYLLFLPETETTIAKHLVDLGFISMPNLLTFNYLNNAASKIWLLKRHEFRYLRFSLYAQFNKGLVAILGGETIIKRLDFLVYGEKIVNPWLMNLAYDLEILSPSGNLMSFKDLHNSPSCLAKIQAYNSVAPLELSRALDQLTEYFHKKRELFDLNLDLSSGTSFQQDIWMILTEIKYGQTLSYTEIAEIYLQRKESKSKVEVRPRQMTRAVGAACAANPLGIFIPCHRVLGVDGKLVGYKDGLAIKDNLLNMELLGL